VVVHLPTCYSFTTDITKAGQSRKLFVWIREARDLMGVKTESEARVNASENGQAHSEKEKDEKQKQQSESNSEAPLPYCEVKWGNSKQKTSMWRQGDEPCWFERFHLYCPIFPSQLPTIRREVDLFIYYCGAANWWICLKNTRLKCQSMTPTSLDHLPCSAGRIYLLSPLSRTPSLRLGLPHRSCDFLPQVGGVW